MKQIVSFLILISILTPVFARWGDGIDINNIKIDARAEVAIGYDDNILLEKDALIDDMFLNLRPYVDLEVPFNPETRFYMSYDADIYCFFDISSEDSISQVFLAGFDFSIRSFYGVLLEEYVLPQDRDGILYTNRIERSNNIPSILLGVDLNRFSLEGIYKLNISRYEDKEYDRDEYDEESVSVISYYHVFTKTDILIELNYADLEYVSETVRNGEYSQAQIGIKGQITSRIEGMLKGGYQNREYDASKEKFDETVFEADVIWKISDTKTLDLKYIKSAKESLILGNNFYKLNRFSIEFKMDNNPGILLGCGGFFENDKFPFTDNSTLREDDVYQIFVRAGFRFNKGLAIETKYRLLERDSNYNDQDYTQNVTSIYATIQL